jgi:hypothetical protein
MFDSPVRRPGFRRRKMIQWTKAALGTYLLALGVLALSLPQEAGAQERDFLFREPRVSLAFNWGYGMQRAGSDIYDFVTDELTVDKGDFSSFLIGGSFGIRVMPKVEVALELSYGNSNTRSEFRDWVDMDDLPIEQNTKLSWLPVTASVKAYLFERGRRISRLAWVPGTWSPYVGAGGGWVYYEFRQVGDFVDYETYDIFSDRFVSEGDAGIVHVLAGAEFSLSPSFFLTGEGRYSWAEAPMSSDFVDFDPIDLSGFQATIGLAVRF